MPLAFIRNFFKLEATSGIFLLVAAVIALIIDNSPWHNHYQAIIHAPISINSTYLQLSMPLVEWINQGLMAIFFLLVGMEIKREIFLGEMNSWRKIALPIMAALGGMIIPTLIYLGFNWHNPAVLRGWAIPTATDIAFSLGILSLLHNRILFSMKIFLTALAIFDDIGAIIIIAIFYTSKIYWVYLSFGLISLLILVLLNHFQIKKLTPYLLIGIILWYLMLRSGVHAVLAGVLLAFTIPLHSKDHDHASPLQILEKKLHPWVAFLILPVFGLTNAGVSFSGISWQYWFNSVTLGVTLGLLIGKQLGVFGATWLAVKMKLVSLPEKATWKHIYGIALLCGVGFTMSLFIGSLAFPENSSNLAAARVGIFCGSLFSGLLGYLVLRSPSKA